MFVASIVFSEMKPNYYFRCLTEKRDVLPVRKACKGYDYDGGVYSIMYDTQEVNR